MSLSGARLLPSLPGGSPSRRAGLLLALLLVVAAGLRLRGLDWDEGNHLHPDERFISMVEEKVEAPRGVREYFDSRISPLNPYNQGEGSFVYGTLPLFLTKATAHAVGMPGYGGVYKVGRALSALFDLLTVWLVYRVARHFVGRGFALAASALHAFAPLAIQSSHFWTVETTLAALSTLTLLGCVRMALGRSTAVQDLATGLALGLAVACKVTALALLAPLGVAALLRVFTGPGPGRGRAAAWGRAVAGGSFAALGAAVAVRCALPYVFLGPSPFSFRLDPRYLADLKSLANLSSSFAGFPPALQWADRSLLFPIENFVLFGAGPAFGLCALLGAAWAAFTVRRASLRALAPLLLYVAVLCTYHGTALVKSIRYFFPAYPAFAVLAAALLACAGGPGRPVLRRLAAGVVVLGTALSGLSFASVYTRPHTRVAASRWIQANVPAPARIANEAWDDGLPLPIPGLDAGRYAGPVLDLWVPEDRAKVEALVSTLSSADWIAVTSNRVYANVTRIPDVYPMAVAYYRALFSGELGFRAEADFSSYPGIGPLRFPTDRAEEQFTVYDHPRVLLYRKTRGFSADRTRALLSRTIRTKPPTIWDWEKLPRRARRTVAPLRPTVRPEVAAASRVPAPPRSVPGSTRATLVWLGAVLLVGAVAAPLVFAAFPRLVDRGFGFAKTAGLLVATLVSDVLLRSGGLRSPRETALAGLAGLLVLSLILGSRGFPRLARHVRERRQVLLAGELVFLAGFLLFLGLRSMNPEITWGEKPMDLSLLNVFVRAGSLPVSDPWFAGAPLGYYAFGHQAMAFLTLLTDLPTRLTYNLAMALLGGLVAQGAFSLVLSWAGSVRAGLAGASLLTLLGNLAGLREWLVERRPRGLPLDWHYFWATSRVVKDTINEYPLWGLLFADLHAHVLAVPFFLLFAAACLELVRDHASGAGPARLAGASVVVGVAAAGQALTNGWDVPFLGGLVVLTGLVAAAGEAGVAGRLRAAATTILAGGTAVVVFGALRWRGAARPGIGWNGEAPAPLVDVLTIFGLFLYAAFAWWLAWDREDRTRGGRLRSPLLASGVVAALVLSAVVRSAAPLCAVGAIAFAVVALRRECRSSVRLAAGFVAAGLGLVLFPQYAYVSDRMNTFFKLHLEAWLALSLGTAVLAFGGAGRPARFGRWPRAVRLGLGLLVCGALFTGVTAARGALDTARPTFRPSAPRLTLDGLAFLGQARPGELSAVEWLQSAVRGTPVLLEAQGPSYQDFSRISMMTGIPTVLGWEHHVSQRGNGRAEIEERRSAVRAIFSTPDTERIRPLLERYRVAYVYVGWLERATYPSSGLRKFATDTGAFEEVYANREVRIFRVIGASGDGAVPVLVPSVAPVEQRAEAPPEDEAEAPPVFRAKPAPGLPFEGLREPRAVAVDARGRVWVTDFGNSRLRVFDGSGGLLGGWGGRGSGTFGLREPSGISLRGDRLLLADTWNGRVSLFDLDGTWKASAAGFFGPRGVALGPDGRMWVADTGNHRVLAYRDLGVPPAVIGKEGSGPLEFSSPVGIVVGPSGDVYVADSGNGRVQVLSSAGAFRAAISVDRWKGALEPQLALDAGERLYAASPGTNEVLAFDRSGRLLWARGLDDSGRKLAMPAGIAVDEARDCIWVVNAGDGTVVRLSPKTPASSPR